MSAPAAPVVRPALGGKAVELLSQALLITAVPAASPSSNAASVGAPAARAIASATTTASSRQASPRSASVRAVARCWPAGAALTSSDTAAGPPRARAAETTVAIPSISARVP